jgi:hypothetical protein
MGTGHAGDGFALVDCRHPELQSARMAHFWPETPVWVTGNSNRPTLSFSERKGAEFTAAVLSNRPERLARLGHATRTAVMRLTGVMIYPEASELLRSGDESSFPADPDASRFWPKLMYMVDGSQERWRVILGASGLAEAPRSKKHDPRAHAMPFPTAVDVVWDLDLLVEEATCLLTGCDAYEDALKALRALTRDTRPMTSKPKADPFQGGPGKWLNEWETPIAGWSEAGPRTISGGLPGSRRRS